MVVATRNGVQVVDRGGLDHTPSVDACSIAELSALVVTPALDRSVGEDGARMPLTGVDRGRIRQTFDTDELRAIDLAEVAELSVVVATPAHHASFGALGTREETVRGDRDRVCQSGHHNRNVAVVVGSISELTSVVASPAPHPTIRGARARVPGTGIEIDDNRKVDDTHRVGRVRVVVVVAQLSVLVVTPALCGTASDTRARVLFAESEFDHIGESVHLDGGRRIDVRPVPEFTFTIPSPTNCGVVVFRCARVPASGRDRCRVA